MSELTEKQRLIERLNLPLDEVIHRNPHNKWLTRDVINTILQQFGVISPVRNLELYQRAFIHKSFIKTRDLSEPNLKDYSLKQLEIYAQAIPMQTDCNERLEFIGDSVLCLSVVDYLYHRFPDQSEGFLTKTRIELIRGENLARLAKRFKWGDYLMLSRTQESHRYSDYSYLEDVFESLIGAIYLDFGGRNGAGLFHAYTFIVNIIEHSLDLSQIIYRDNNYKDLLLQYYHKNFDGQFPKYKTISERDQYQRRLFKVGVLGVDGQILVTAAHQKKVKAEQLASRKALKYFDQEVCSSSDEE